MLLKSTYLLFELTPICSIRSFAWAAK